MNDGTERTAAPELVKLGGSLFDDAEALRALLARLALAGAPLVLIGGGGRLADAVRALQPRLGFSDAAAHHMAILAMEQSALALADIEPRLAPSPDPAAIAAAHRAGKAALWLPAAMARGAQVPASWDVTSDSLAACLAIRLGARLLTLVKAASVAAPDGPPERWAADGLVDAHFPHIARGFAGQIRAIAARDAATHWPIPPAGREARDASAKDMAVHG